MNRKPMHPSLKRWRELERLNQEQAAQQLGISQAHYSRIERGVQFPRRQLAKVISDTTGVPFETVLGV